MKIITVLGARPQFVKAAVVSHAFSQAGIHEIIIHTGQHFDSLMSDVFFQDLDLPQPTYHLNIHSLSHGAMTGRMMEKLEELLQQQQPDWVCVYGDTNSTLAGALVASKLNIRLAHIEAGLRSFNRQMPEEINRVVTDHLSQRLFAPTQLAVECLQKEGITQGVHLVGDVMMDAILNYQAKARETSNILATHHLKPDTYYLATIHRPSNTDHPDRLTAILESFTTLDLPVVFPIHPRTVARIQSMELNHYLETDSILAIPPLGYLDMLMVERNSRAIITDSGGIQKEAYILGRPCFTMRDETEWQETVEIGWNQLVQPHTLRETIINFTLPATAPLLYGQGDAAIKIADILLAC
jgi:UDP-N-acetylglucosamine 2-epimerase